MAAADSSDPYKVLGIDRDADSNAINRAYSQKKYAARGNDALTQQIEAAHSALMMSALTARMKGKAVSKAVAYADTEPLFPWRPKRWDATPKVCCICMHTWAWMLPQPHAACTVSSSKQQ
jgi:hypothetical protein